MFDQIGGKGCVLVAHPDDETLWAGGLVASRPDIEWTCICLSYPRRAEELMRAFEFFKACKTLRMWPRLLPIVESDPNRPFTHFPTPQVFDEFDFIITHGAKGEYGHFHHICVHNFVKDYIKKPTWCFGYGMGEFELLLEDNVFEHKMKALQCYTIHMTAEPKHVALLKRYPIAREHKETYNAILKK